METNGFIQTETPPNRRTSGFTVGPQPVD